jgi:hypothetical protein
VGIRTSNLLIRSQMLYPVELRAPEANFARFTYGKAVPMQHKRVLWHRKYPVAKSGRIRVFLCLIIMVLVPLAVPTYNRAFLMSRAFINAYEDEHRACAYATLEFPGTYYLAFRDLPPLVRRYSCDSRLTKGPRSIRRMRFPLGASL